MKRAFILCCLCSLYSMHCCLGNVSQLSNGCLSVSADIIVNGTSIFELKNDIAEVKSAVDSLRQAVNSYTGGVTEFSNTFTGEEMNALGYVRYPIAHTSLEGEIRIQNDGVIGKTLLRIPVFLKNSSFISFSLKFTFARISRDCDLNFGFDDGKNAHFISLLDQDNVGNVGLNTLCTNYSPFQFNEEPLFPTITYPPGANCIASYSKTVYSVTTKNILKFSGTLSPNHLRFDHILLTQNGDVHDFPGLASKITVSTIPFPSSEKDNAFYVGIYGNDVTESFYLYDVAFTIRTFDSDSPSANGLL